MTSHHLALWVCNKRMEDGLRCLRKYSKILDKVS